MSRLVRRMLLALCLGCAPRSPPPEPPLVEYPPGARAVIHGQVLHALRHTPIAGAIVVLRCACISQERTRSTDAAGTYRVDGLPPGRYLVEVRAGEASATRTFDLAVDRTLAADFQLVPDPRSH